MKHNIRNLGYFLLCIFAILILYLTYLVVQKGDFLARHPQNHRIAAREAGIIRGTIFDRNGFKLAQTEWQNNQGKRLYYTEGKGSPFAQVVGYVSPRYGASGIEAAYGKELLGLTEADALKNFLDKLVNRTPRGNDLILTLDANVQRTALKGLNGRKGAVVVLNPKTGEILAMVSSPIFNANDIDQAEVWNSLNKDEENAPLLNRATQGAYAPGSVLKIVIGTGILENKVTQVSDIIDCPGYVVVDGNKIVDNKAHGKVDFIRAVAMSCNTYFAQEGSQMGWDGFNSVISRFGLDKSPDLQIPVRAGTFATNPRQNESQLAESSFGQGDTLISPLQMALACSAIANQGVIMKPYLVKEIRKSSGTTIRVTKETPWLTATEPQFANVVKDGMIAAVDWGTATAAALPNIKVAGKTGTAETKSQQQPDSLPHAWFVGFAPANDPQVVVAVIVEKSGSGSSVAAPIAKEVMAVALQKS